MISFQKLRKLLTEQGKNFNTLRVEKIVGSATIEKLRGDTGYIDTRTIDRLCDFLNCQPGDIMEHKKSTKDCAK